MANGSHLVEQSDQFGGLLYFVEALRLDQDHPTREAIHRMRIGSLLAECPKLLQLWIHQSPVSSVAFSPDGQHLVTTPGAAAQIWDVNTGAPFGPPMLHTSTVQSAVFSPDGRKLLTRNSWLDGGGYEQAQVWDAETANPITPSLQHTGWVSHAIFRPNSSQIALWVTDRDRSSSSVRLLDAATGQPVWAPVFIEGNPWYGESLHPPLFFSPDGNNLLIRTHAPSTRMNQLRVLDANTGAQVVPCWNVDAIALGAVFSADGKVVATLSSNGIARVLKTSNGEPITPPLKNRLSELAGAAFSPGSRLLATSGGLVSDGRWEQESMIWDLATSTALTKSLEGTVQFRADGYPVLLKLGSPQLGQETLQMFDPITGKRAYPAIEHRLGSELVFDPMDLKLAKSGADGLVWLWELAAGLSPLMILQDPPGRLSASFSEGGDYVVTSASDGTVRVVRTDNGQAASAVVLQANGCTEASVSANGQRIVTFGANGIAQIWNAANGQAITPPLRHKYLLIKYASFSPDGSRLATISAERANLFGADRFQLWDSQTGKSLTDFPGASRPVVFAAFSHDSKRVLTWGRLGSAHIWDADTGREIRAIGEVARYLNTDVMGEFSPDGRWIVTPGDSCRVWDAGNGQPIGRPMKHTAGVQQAAFSPDGLRVATAGRDSAARIWDASSGEPVTAAMKHPAPVHRVKFSRDGRLLGTVCNDNSVRVWDTATGESITPPFRHPGQVYDITFSADGRRLLTACYDGRVRIWEIPRDSRPLTDLVLLAQLLAGRRIDQTSGLEPLDNDALRRAWETLKTRYPEEFKRTTSERLAKHENQAQYCEEVGLCSPAIWHLNHLIEAQPQEWKWRKWRGWLYARSGEKENAEADFSAAIQLGAPKESLWWQVALAWQQRGDLREALSAMERTGEPGPRDPAFWVAKASMLERTNQLDEAYQAIGRALLLAPSDDFVWRALVNFADRHAGLERAVQLFEAAARSNPLNVELNEFAALNRGTLLERTNQFNEACEAYSAGLQLGGLSPRSAHTREQLLSRRSEVLKRLGRHGESIADFERWLGLSSLTAFDCNDRAWSLATGPVEVRDPERALMLAKKAVGLESTNALYVDTLGVAYYRAGQWLKAAEALHDAVRLSAGDSSYPVEVDLLFLAMTYHRVGDQAKAKDYYDKALQRWGKHRAYVSELDSFRDEAEKLLGISKSPMSNGHTQGKS